MGLGALGSMGLVVVQKAPKLYGLVRKPLATLHSAAETTSPRWAGGLGGLGLGAPGLHGPSGVPGVPEALRPSKEAFGDAAQSSRRTTSPGSQ